MANNEFEFALPNGSLVRTGNIKPETRPVSVFRNYPEEDLYTFEQCMKILTNPKRKRAREIDFCKRITNQGQRSSCNAYAAGRALEKARGFTGQEPIELGYEHIYAGINGGRDQGSHLEAGMRWITEHGCCTRDMIPYQAYLKRDVSIEASRIGRNFRAFECYALPKSPSLFWRALITALCRREPVVVAVHVGRNYMRSDKVAGFDSGPGNHAVHADDVAFKTTSPRTFDDLIIDVAGSWDRSWGYQGRGYHQLQHFVQPLQYHVMYAIRSAVQNPNEISPTLAV